MKRLGILILSALCLAAIATTAPAQAKYPLKPVKIIVPYAPGGVTDAAAHFVAQPLSEAFGQPFVIEHRPGATGAIAAEAVARAPPDGYTLFLAGLSQIAIMPVAIKTSFDPLKDVVPISAIATNPLVLTVHTRLPVASVADFVAYARKREGRLNYAALGTGSITHLAMALFAKRAGLAMTPVMYRGGASAVTAPPVTVNWKPSTAPAALVASGGTPTRYVCLP